MKYRVVRNCFWNGQYYFRSDSERGSIHEFPSTIKLPRHFERVEPPKKTVKKKVNNDQNRNS